MAVSYNVIMLTFLHFFQNKNYKGTKNNIAILHLRIPAMDGRRFVRVHGRLATRMYDEKTLLGNIQCYIVDLKKDKSKLITGKIAIKQSEDLS